MLAVLSSRLLQLLLANTQALSCKGRELAPLSKPHKSAFVSVSQLCQLTPSAHQAVTLTEAQVISLLHNSSLALSIPEQPFSCYSYTSRLYLSVPAHLSVLPTPGAVCKCRAHTILTLALAINTPGKTPRFWVPPAPRPFAKVTVLSSDLKGLPRSHLQRSSADKRGSVQNCGALRRKRVPSLGVLWNR